MISVVEVAVLVTPATTGSPSVAPAWSPPMTRLAAAPAPAAAPSMSARRPYLPMTSCPPSLPTVNSDSSSIRAPCPRPRVNSERTLMSNASLDRQRHSESQRAAELPWSDEASWTFGRRATASLSRPKLPRRVRVPLSRSDCLGRTVTQRQPGSRVTVPVFAAHPQHGGRLRGRCARATTR